MYRWVGFDVTPPDYRGCHIRPTRHQNIKTMGGFYETVR